MVMLDKLAAVSIDANSLGLPKVAANNATWGNIIGGVFIFIGAWAVLFIVIGAVRYAASAGDQGLITKAKDTILYAVIGLVVSMLAFAGVQWVLGRL
jgi:succinate dehydrogenase/fumarate reductase cytochrome b subunit